MTDHDLRWPPPGLERMQGDLSTIASRAWLANVLLVLPVLLLVGSTTELTVSGSLTEVWQIMIVVGAVGLALATDAIVWVVRTMRRVGRALDGGYDAFTIMRVLADRRRDMGFLMTGARQFGSLDEPERVALAKIRIAAALLFTGGGLWMVLAASVALFAAARGVASQAGVYLFTLLPAGLAVAVAAVGALIQGRRIRVARRAWHKQPWSADLASQDARVWQEAARQAAEPVSGRGLSRLAIVAGVVAGLVVLPMLTLVPAAAVGPVLTSIALPSYSTVQGKAARTEAFRGYGVEPDPSISPLEAGEMLQRLAWGDPERGPEPGERRVENPIHQPFPETMEEDGNPTGLSMYVWADSLLDGIAGAGADQVMDYFRFLTADPLTAEFSRLAHAGDIDVGGGRWQTPFPPELTAAMVPFPRLAFVRRAAYAHVGSAILAHREGRDRDAEELLREVISVGFLLEDGGITLIDNLYGVVVVDIGATALERLYDVSGRAPEADAMRLLRATAERAVQEMPQGVGLRSDRLVTSLAGVVTDTVALKGLRWELTMMLTTLAPCLDMHRIVFGMDEEYDRLLEQIHDSLVQYPSEEALFELARYGWLGREAPGGRSLLGTLIATYMNTGENSCGRYLQHLSEDEISLF